MPLLHTRSASFAGTQRGLSVALERTMPLNSPSSHWVTNSPISSTGWSVVLPSHFVRRRRRFQYPFVALTRAQPGIRR